MASALTDGAAGVDKEAPILLRLMWKQTHNIEFISILNVRCACVDHGLLRADPNIVTEWSLQHYRSKNAQY